MSRLFTTKFIVLLIGAVLLAEMLALGHIYLDTHAQTKRDAELVGQLLSEQSHHFQMSSSPATKPDYRSVFDLEKLGALQNLNINFVSRDGQLLDTNHPSQTQQHAQLSWLAVWLLDKHIGLISIIQPVNMGERYIGDLVITNNLSNELGEVATQAIEILAPWFLLFVVSSYLLARLFSFLLAGIEPLLLARKTEQAQHEFFSYGLSLVNPRRLPVRLIAAVGALKGMSHEQKRKVVDAQELERKRLAAELHDELGQHLTALRFELDKLSEIQAPQIEEMVSALKARSRRMSDIVRSNLEQLRPPDLSDHGLQFCLEQLVNDWCIRHPQHRLNLNIRCQLRLLDCQSQLVVYRLIQECLTNISRHAGQQVEVNITLMRQVEGVVITVTDNGAGCDLDKSSRGFGLLGMRERVEAVSGEIDISSKAQQGMQIVATLPLG